MSDKIPFLRLRMAVGLAFIVLMIPIWMLWYSVPLIWDVMREVWEREIADGLEIGWAILIHGEDASKHTDKRL